MSNDAGLNEKRLLNHDLFAGTGGTAGDEGPSREVVTAR
jgi:hypothetical protein